MKLRPLAISTKIRKSSQKLQKTGKTGKKTEKTKHWLTYEFNHQIKHAPKCK